MPLFEHEGVAINYEVRGTGFPLLLIAPGGMNSSIEWWARAALNPLEVYGDDFQLVAMDQRNAGASTGPLDVEDPWGSTWTTSSGSWTTSTSTAATSSAAASAAPTRSA
jgi:pimeloyl-ACP methyl ester carboxylesterase